MKHLSHFRPWIAFVLVACSLSSARAGNGPPGSAAGDERAARDAVLGVDRSLETRWVGTWRVRWSWPARAGLALGTLVVEQPQSWDCTTVCDYRGWQAQVEVAAGGVQLAAGFANLIAEKKRNRFFLRDVLTGFGIRGVVMRTYGESTLTPESQTLAGVEFAYTVTRISMTLGVTRRISAGAEGGRWHVTGGAGWGF